MTAAAGRQDASHRGFRQEAARRGAASAALREWMADVARLARSLSIEEYPGVAERFRMPRSQSYLAQQAPALAFIKALRELDEIFAERGFDEEAIAQAEALIGQIEAANRAKTSRALARIEQTAKLMLTSQRGLAIVREIDANLQRKLRKNGALLAEWNSIRRVHRPWKNGAAQPPEAPDQSQPITSASPAEPRKDHGEMPSPRVMPASELSPGADAALRKWVEPV